jgi:hypothetical protein
LNVNGGTSSGAVASTNLPRKSVVQFDLEPVIAPCVVAHDDVAVTDLGDEHLVVEPQHAGPGHRK